MSAYARAVSPQRVETASSARQAADVRAANRRLPVAKTVAGPLRMIRRNVYGVVVGPLYLATGRSRRTNFGQRTSGVGRKRQSTGLGRMAAIAGIAAVGGAGLNGANGSIALSKLEALSPKHFELAPRMTG
jgi:hypothetical protein